MVTWPFTKTISLTIVVTTYAHLTCSQQLVQSSYENISALITISGGGNPPHTKKTTKPFILHYSVIANMLHFSVSGKACLPVCSVTLLASPKLEARGLIGELLREYN